MIRLIIYIIIALLISCFHVFAQEISWPSEMETVTKEHYVRLSDDCRLENFESAVSHLNWLLENVPDLHVSVYQNGLTAYRSLEKAEQDPEKKALHQQFVMKLYDLRMSYFGDSAGNMSRKALDAYVYFRKDNKKAEEIMNMMSIAMELNKATPKKYLFVPYLDIAGKCLTSGIIDEDAYLNAYQSITTALCQHEPDTPEEFWTQLDQLLFRDLPESSMNCTTLKTKILPGLRMQDGNYMFKQVIKLSVHFECMGEPFFLNALEDAYNEKPGANLAISISKIYESDKDFQGAEKYLVKAMELAEDEVQRSEISYRLALLSLKKGMKQQAREFIYASLKNDPDNKAYYKFLGDLYFNSYSDCKGGVSRVQDRLIFIAAYEQYKLAEDIEAMRMAREQFPAMEDIHQENFRVGDRLNTGCWVRKDVSIERRP